MRLRKFKLPVMAAVISLAAVITLLGFFDAARGQELRKPKNDIVPPQALKEPDYNFIYGPFVTYTLFSELDGTVVGTGNYMGSVRCNRDHCSRKIQLSYTLPPTDPVVLAYKFRTRQAVDPVAGRVVVEGTGTLTSGQQKDRFSFTAVFQDNGDGTVYSSYNASNPAASFIIPEAPGPFEITPK